MKNDDLNQLITYAGELAEPENLFSGLRLPVDFILPENILVFYHNYTAPAPNAHSRYTLVIPLDKMIYFIEQTQLQLSPGMVLLVHPHTMRYLHPDSAGYRRLFITFTATAQRDFLPGNQIFHLDTAHLKLLWEFLQSYRSGQAEVCAVRLFLLLNSLKSAHAAQVCANKLPGSIAGAIRFIEQHLNTPLGITQVAEAVGLSESHLRCLFKKHLGTTPGRYLLCQRLDAAKYRLLQTDQSISDIAQSCGFSNVFVFSAFFKKNTGITPSQFRRKSN